LVFKAIDYDSGLGGENMDKIDEMQKIIDEIHFFR